MVEKIPLLDLRAEYAEIKESVDASIRRVVESARFILGDEVTSFEQDFAAFCRADHAIGVGSGTDALYVALKTCGVEAGDEVITTPMTFIATSEAISLCGAKPVFVDVDPQTHNMDASLIEAVITPRTKVILPVHIHGYPVDMDPILVIARRFNLYVIEDAAQAQGAEYKGRRVGTLADLACFSFYPGKNLGAYGDAGAITTNNAELAKKARLLRDHGRTSKYEHQVVSFNWRIDALQAAILHTKLPYLEGWNRRRHEIALKYNELLKNSGAQLPVIDEDFGSVWHHYAINISNRDDVQKKLKEKGIETGIHYPIPLHIQPAYQFLEYEAGDFPMSETVAETTLSLPMYPAMTDEQVQRVAEMLLGVLSERISDE
ncbi:MAG: DegT/DnrJ/EryC1/StrS family aminotransferase [Anaerolineae bacterium]|nr:DegT/DnrJ/EryC1/StrS family aminotransferase [Anaerolineae bacterium]